jgi:transposase
MENFENAIIDNTVASEHPVLKQLKDRIAELEASIEQKNTSLQTALDNSSRYRNEKWQYEERVKTVLIEALEDHDEDTVRWIAEQLNIQLTKTATYEVNVTFTIDVEYEIGSTPDPDWDFEYEVSGSDIVDYTSDVVWSKTS